MHGMGFRSLLVLAKIGYELRDEFAGTLEADHEGAFGPLLDALEGTSKVLRLTDDEYRWVSDGAFFEACSGATIEGARTHAQKSVSAEHWSMAS
jgi:hypothetical protein